MTMGQSPRVVYQVSPVRVSMVWRITARSLIEVRWRTSPSGVTKALNPVGAAWTTHRPVSSARTRELAPCWVCTMVNQDEKPMEGLGPTKQQGDRETGVGV